MTKIRTASVRLALGWAGRALSVDNSVYAQSGSHRRGGYASETQAGRLAVRR
jgi:hypothetical protein